MPVPAPVPDDATASDLRAWPETRASATAPQPEGFQAAAPQHVAAEPGAATQDGRVTVVALALPTEIDITNSLDACVQLCAAIDDGAQLIIADMTLTGFCDTSGFRMLLAVREIAYDRGTEFRIVMPPGGAVL